MSVVNKMLRDLDERNHHHLNLSIDETASRTHEKGSWTFLKRATIIVFAMIVAVVGYRWLFESKSAPAAHVSSSTDSLSQNGNQEATTATIHSVDTSQAEKLNLSVNQSIEQPLAINTPSSVSLLIQEPNIETQTSEKNEVNLNVISEKIDSDSSEIINQQSTQSLKLSDLNSTKSDETIAVEKNTKVIARTAPNNLVMKQVSIEQQKETSLTNAEDWINQGLFSSAEKELKALIKEHSDYHPARELLASVYLQTARNSDLVSVLEDGIKLFPQHVSYRVILAQYFAQQQQWENVLKLLGDKTPNSEHALILKALASQQLKQHELAVSSYQTLLKMKPNRGDWWLGLSISLEALKQNQPALQALQRAQNDARLSASQLSYVQHRIAALKGN